MFPHAPTVAASGSPRTPAAKTTCRANPLLASNTQLPCALGQTEVSQMILRLEGGRKKIKEKKKKRKIGQTHSYLVNTVLGSLPPLVAAWVVSCVNLQHHITKLK